MQPWDDDMRANIQIACESSLKKRIVFSNFFLNWINSAKIQTFCTSLFLEIEFSLKTQSLLKEEVERNQIRQQNLNLKCLFIKCHDKKKSCLWKIEKRTQSMNKITFHSQKRHNFSFPQKFINSALHLKLGLLLPSNV